jgi:hypothetical protein
MIPVANPIPEPPTFDVECRAKGNAWLAKLRNAGKTKGFPSRCWTRFEPELEEAFHSRCGYWAMRIQSGTVDHFYSKALPTNRCLVFEWSNYRYAESSVNSSKKNYDDKVLDPFEIKAGWFGVDLPSMLLICTPQLPAHLKAKAVFTLEKLHLEGGSKVRRNRKRWYDDYKSGKINMTGLEDYAPLVADAVKKLEAAQQPLP